MGKRGEICERQGEGKMRGKREGEERKRREEADGPREKKGGREQRES